MKKEDENTQRDPEKSEVETCTRIAGKEKHENGQQANRNTKLRAVKRRGKTEETQRNSEVETLTQVARK